jgi:hypothetical protein
MSLEIILSDRFSAVRVQWLLENAVSITSAPGGETSLERPWISCVLPQPERKDDTPRREVSLDQGRVGVTLL